MFTTQELRLRRACPVCVKRKVKCDKEVPCGNCKRRGIEAQCVEAEGAAQKVVNEKLGFEKVVLPELLKFWQVYEQWILDIGLYKCKVPNMWHVERTDESDISSIVSSDISFALMNNAMENLGALYFGCIGDVGELFGQLEQYWHTRTLEIQGMISDNFTHPDRYYRDALLWSIFTMSIYYMTPEMINELFGRDIQRVAKEQIDHMSREKSFQIYLIDRIGYYTVSLLNKADYMVNPDIRFIQTFLILSSTCFLQIDSLLTDSMLVQSIYIAKLYGIENFRPLINDNPTLAMAKITFGKLWYRLSTIDYLYSSPSRKIVLHLENSSLLKHAAFWGDQPHIDVYQDENTFEVLFWKIISFDRDLDRYLTVDPRPPMKTLDAIQRELGILQYKVTSQSLQEKSVTSKFEKTLSSFLLHAVFWKLHKLYLIFYQTSDAMPKLVYHTEVLIRLAVRNFEKKKIFNHHPIILMTLTRVAPFFKYVTMFYRTDLILRITSDLEELIGNLPRAHGPVLVKLKRLMKRMDAINSLWDEYKIPEDTILKSRLGHPVLKILQDDIKKIKSHLDTNRIVLRSLGDPLKGGRQFGDFEEEDYSEWNVNEEFRQIVSSFEDNNGISFLLE